MLSDKQRERADRLCQVIKELSGYDPNDNSRRQDVVTVRAMVAYQLLSEGFSSVKVAEYFGMNHSSILNYKERWLAFFMPGWEAERDLWEKFRRSIQIS